VSNVSYLRTPTLSRCFAHTTGIPFTSRPSDNPLGSRPWAMASTMSGASKVRRLKKAPADEARSYGYASTISRYERVRRLPVGGADTGK